MLLIYRRRFVYPYQHLVRGTVTYFIERRDRSSCTVEESTSSADLRDHVIRVWPLLQRKLGTALAEVVARRPEQQCKKRNPSKAI